MAKWIVRVTGWWGKERFASVDLGIEAETRQGARQEAHEAVIRGDVEFPGMTLDEPEQWEVRECPGD